MTTYLTNELVPRSLAAAGLDHGVVDAMTDAQFSAAQTLMTAALIEAASRGSVTIADPDTDRPAPLASIMRLGTPGSPNEKVLAFSFSNLASEGLFPIIGLIVAAFGDDFGLGNLDSVVTAGRALWNSAALLRSPDDDDALEALSALGKSKLALTGTPKSSPTNVDIAKYCNLGEESLAAALAALASKKIIKCVKWGSLDGRYEDPNNAWAMRL